MDLNADVGESYGSWVLGDDAALLPLITSANVACGFHAGDPLTLRRTVAGAVAHDVVIGAQVGYPDLVGFGRRAMDVAADELEADVLYQLGALDGLARAAGSRVRYVKPHGALYHRVLYDEGQASAVVSAVIAYDAGLSVLTMADGALASAAAAQGLRVVREGFADRAYGADGRLVPRDQPGAVHTDAAVVAAQAVRLAEGGEVDSLCLHGDTPGAVEHASAVRSALSAAGIAVAGFA
jgi:5-oxoprolinase (ATP-hydrolysing) subunit A